MKQQKKTYGVIGMMEFQAVIKVGRNNMKIHFSDGSLSALGNNPAKFTTDNYMVQHAIENSAEFKRGLIRLLNTVTLADEVKIVRNAPKALNAPIPIEIPTEGTNLPKIEKGEVATATHDASQSLAAGTHEAAAAAHDEAAGTHDEAAGIHDEAAEETAEAAEEGTELKRVEVSGNEDAKDYLEEHFGVVRSKLRNREIILSTGASNGVEFVFVK